MDASMRKFTLPNTQDMLARLTKVSQQPLLIEGFYPLLLRYAGETKTGAGVVIMLRLAIHDYVSDISDREIAAALAGSLMFRMDEFVTALVVDDTIRQATLARLQQMRQG